MDALLHHWCIIYRQYKHESICLDIETTRYGGPISVFGFYRPSDGIPDVTQLVRGESLTWVNVIKAVEGSKLLITFNGISFDLKRIQKEFPNAISRAIPVLDLYQFARRMDLNTNLKVLE